MSGSDTVSLRSRDHKKLCEGWLEHKSHGATGHQYVRLWLVLKGNVLYIFKDSNTSDQSPLGSLTIDNHTVFRAETGDPTKGYKFDLTTKTKNNRFKSKKLSERELWRAYIMGVASGSVPEDLDLLEDQVDVIKAVIREYKTGESAAGLTGNRVSMISGGSGGSTDSGVGRQSLFSGFSGATGATGASGSLTGSDGSGGGGPIMTNKFYNERSESQTTPSWFFSGCSREKAEHILVQYCDHGNTLMRESTSHMKSGSYVISKRVWDKTNNQYTYEHYEVMRVAGGYKLNVQNEHPPMHCLTDVMEYFRETSGRDTRLLDTNDPYRIKPAHDPEYQRQIRRTNDPEPWTWPPPDYEDPFEPDQAPNGGYPGGGSSTVSPGILRNKQPSTGSPKKSVDFHRNTVSGTSIRSPQTKTTIGDIVQRSHAAAHLREFDDMIHSFEQENVYVNDDPTQNPDTVDSGSSSTLSRRLMPLPPTPHESKTHSYVNANAEVENLPVAPPPPRSVPDMRNRTGSFHDNRDVIKSLPVAPTPPSRQNDNVYVNDPRQSLATVKNSTVSHVDPSIPAPPPPPPIGLQQSPRPPPGQVQSSVQLPNKNAKAPPKTASKLAPKAAPKTATKPAQKPVSHVPSTIGKPSPRSQQNTQSIANPVSTPSLLELNIAQKRGQLRKTNSAGSGLGSQVNPRSPGSMPTWDNKLRTPTSPSGVGFSVSNQAPPVNHIGAADAGQTSGVDNSNPGGVNNLSRMFEKTALVSPRAQPQPNIHRPGWRSTNLPGNRKSAPVFSLYDEQDERPGQLPVDYLHPASFTNSKGPLCFTNKRALGRDAINSPSSNFTELYDTYDDTAIPEPVHHTGQPRTNVNFSERTNQAVNGPRVPKPPPNPDGFTPPSAEALSHRRKTDPGPCVTGLNESFKRRLEGVILGGGTPAHPPQANNVYDELPPIPPDSVTYANDIDANM